VTAPQRVVFGGGVLRQEGLAARIAAHVPGMLGGYAASPRLLGRLDGYVAGAALGQDAGLLGAVILGLRALEDG
jgi:fructokinase